MITKENFKQVLDELGFYKLVNNENQYQNVYGDTSDNSFSLSVDFEQEKFLYPEEIKADRSTTLDFHQNESFVVFECLHRLFSVGYRPENIFLEGKNYQGHDLGWIDILVKDNTGTEYLIIECKTSDSSIKEDEFEKHWKRTLNNGDQLFRYFNTYSKAQFLCLYTADFEDNKLTNNYRLIALKDNEEYLKTDSRLKSFKELRENQGSSQEFFEVWKNTYGQDFSTNGFLEKDSKPFDIGKKKYNIDDLKEIDSSSMQKKYHDFASILRKYNVSSKENAFDKLINLFLAKIVDETYNQTELKCLWKGAAFDNYYDMQDRLQSLYKKGMEEFFKDTVAYVDNSEIEKAFSFLKSKTDEAKSTILEYFRTLKYYNNNPFAFLDVHNESLFYQNAVILKEIVNMIQDIKIKTQNQNQFLGDLFEGFLDQGIKQSEGQFFTPMPIVKFLISSLPLDKLIENSTEIPKVIDYACGAGHFLTEYANQIKPFVEKHKKAKVSKYYQNIHGIEKEYRLSKVSQVSVFMYGQDGIHIFYKDALATNPDIQENSYSVLIANPPYSVKGFLQTLDDEDRSKFELFNSDINLDSNKSIETFFIERAKQLLKPKGIAAIVLPSSVLSNGNIYAKCREIIFKYFDIVAIFESGSGTFGKTGTNTATLFLQKKEEKPSISQHYKNRVEIWFTGNFDLDKYYEDFDLVEKYCSYNEIPLEDYKTLLEKQPNENLLNHELFKTYVDVLDVYSEKGKATNTTKGLNENAKKIRNDIRNNVKKEAFKNLTEDEKQAKINEATVDFIVEIEKEKLYFFMLLVSNPCNVVCVKSPEKKAIKEFLGYEWSDTKGNEGIKYINVKVEKSEDDEESDDTMQQIKGIDGIKTPLFNPKNFNDETKINTIIRSNFEGKNISIPENLAKFVKIVRLVDMIDFSRASFDKAIRTNVQSEKAKIESKYPLVKLGEVAEIKKGKSITSAEVKQGSVKVVAGGIDFAYLHNEANRPENIITVSASGANAGFVNFWKEPVFASDCTTIIANDLLITKYIYNILKTYQQYIFKLQKGQAQPHVYADDLKLFSIPNPPLDIQQKIVDECEAVDSEYEEAQTCINKSTEKISELFEVAQQSASIVYKLSDSNLFSLSIGRRILATEVSDSFNIPVYSANVFEPFGFIDKLLIEDFSKPSVLWGIDGDWMVNTIQENIQFYPTDHCGVLRINTKEIEPKYLAWVFNQKGKEVGFKRSYRASIDRVASLTINLPPLAEQQKIVDQISALEDQIAAAKKIIEEVPARKQAILDKWL